MKTEKKITPFYEMSWNYKYDSNVNFFSQNDWNQTLQTAINQCSAHLFKGKTRTIPNVIEIHPSLIKVFETLEYFHKKDSMLGPRYCVETNNNISPDEIIMYASGDRDTFTLIKILNLPL